MNVFVIGAAVAGGQAIASARQRRSGHTPVRKAAAAQSHPRALPFQFHRAENNKPAKASTYRLQFISCPESGF